MAPKPQSRTVIVGAGVVGSALADELTERGWTDVTVLDQGPLFATGGSSSHAPGLVFRTNGSRTMAKLASYTVHKFNSLRHPDGWCFNPVGGLEVATTPERLVELHRRAGWAQSCGFTARVIDPQECVRRHPLLDVETILGGLYTPDDGLAKALRAVEAQAHRATERGATFVGNQKVLGVEDDGVRVTGVRTTDGVVPADVVVLCAGFWGAELGKAVGLTVPLVPMAHQYARTTPLEVLRNGASPTEEARLPILRHQDRDLYFREHVDHLGIGSYAHRPMPIDMSRLDQDATDMPSSQAFTEEDFAPSWEDSQRLLPALRSASVRSGFNGIFSFTPDGGPMMGEHRDLPGLWVAEAVWVTHSAGVARTMAEWITTGTPDVDVAGCDLYRFEKSALSSTFVGDTSAQAFREVYDILHPHQFRERLRGLRTSPFVARQRELGAFFFEGGGWERPAWYEANADLLSRLTAEGLHIPERDEWSAQFWSPIAIAEAAWTRQGVAMYDMTPLTRLEVEGPGAAAFLTDLTTANVDKSVGSVTYTLMLNERGGVLSDLTVTRLAQDRYQVGANGPLDLDRLTRRLPSDHSVSVRDITGGTCCVGIWGPKARDVVQPLLDADISHEGLKVFRAVETFLGPIPVLIQRVSYVGDLGWEIYTSAEFGEKLWDLLWEAGQASQVIAAGRIALQSLRLEKGYRATGPDLNSDHGPVASGVGFALRKSGGFLGEDAVARANADPWRLQTIVLDDPDAAVLGHEPTYVDGAPVGYVTSAGHSPAFGRTLALAWLPAGLEPGSKVEINYHGDRLSATTHSEPAVDPEASYIRR
ncbi:GcvT family protein [Demetria terragena]|uniref:GcvT family protein n=1 Tax=Demetria terragena TaxID=63959 RepID=UPI00037AE835|nr:FAD-dependent oxidoreductase [Demetria terragena]